MRLGVDVIKVLLKLLLLIGMGFALSANAESLRGKFATNQTYSAEFSVDDGENSDGMRIEHVTITVYLEGSHVPLTYQYDADDYPSVQASPLGFLSIVTNSGGMEGSVTYDYVLPFKGTLVSVGTVQTSLHLGKVQSIDIAKNPKMSSEDVSAMVSRVVDFGARVLPSAHDPHASAAFLFLGTTCRRGKDYTFLKALLAEKEIADDPVFYQKVRSSICLRSQ
jgi:hypothetical protein